MTYSMARMGEFQPSSAQGPQLFLKAYRGGGDRAVDAAGEAVAECRVALVSARVRPAGPGALRREDAGRRSELSRDSSDAGVGSLVDAHRIESLTARRCSPTRTSRFRSTGSGALPSGRIGQVNRRISPSGSLTATGRLVSETAPRAAGLLAADVDVALPVPV